MEAEKKTAPLPERRDTTKATDTDKYEFPESSASSKKPVASRGMCPLSQALWYAGMGWKVFPAPPGKKTGYQDFRHELTGRKWGATNNPDEIRRMWTIEPDASVCVVCGPPSGLFVVEADTTDGHAHDGITAFLALIGKHGGWYDTIEAISPGGSWHVYFKWPAGIEPERLNNGHGRIASGIDIKGAGGMVVAPPSIRPGRDLPYRWKNPPGLFGLADCPKWLLDRCLKPKPVPAPSIAGKLLPRIFIGDRFGLETRTERKLDGILRAAETAQQGSQQSIVYWAARRLFETNEWNRSHAELADMLRHAAGRCGLEEHRIKSAIKSAAQAEGVSI